jgi:hypothetical protein
MESGADEVHAFAQVVVGALELRAQERGENEGSASEPAQGCLNTILLPLLLSPGQAKIDHPECCGGPRRSIMRVKDARTLLTQ